MRVFCLAILVVFGWSDGSWVPTKECHVVSYCHSETTYRHTDSLGPAPCWWLYGTGDGPEVLRVGPLKIEFYDKKPGFCDSLGPCLARMTVRLLPRHRYPTFVYNLTSWYRYKKPVPRGDTLGMGTLWARWKPLPDEDGELPDYAYVEDTGWVLVPMIAVGNAFQRMRAQRTSDANGLRLLPLRPGEPVIDDGR